MCAGHAVCVQHLCGDMEMGLVLFFIEIVSFVQ